MSGDQVNYLSQPVELATLVYRLDQPSAVAAHTGRQNLSSESPIRVSRPSQSSAVAVQVGYPSQPSESDAQIDHPSQLYESAVGTSRPSQSSGSVIRVHRPCLSSESAAHANRPERLMTSSPNRVSTSDERMEPTPQPTNGTVLVMPVLSPVIRPVDPRCLTHRKRPRTVSASHIFDTNDPLQEPTRKRQTAPQARDEDLWTQWRNLARDGRRNT